MPRLVAIVLVIGLAAIGDIGAQQTSTSSHTVLVRKNTALKLALMATLDPASGKVGDDVPLRLARPLVVDGVTLLPADQVVHGRVVKVKPPATCKVGEIDVEVNHVWFADGTDAKTRVFFISRRPEAKVDESYDAQVTRSDVPGAVITEVRLSPFYLLAPFVHSPCHPPVDDTRPVDSTVAVIFTQDHRVQY